MAECRHVNETQAFFLHQHSQVHRPFQCDVKKRFIAFKLTGDGPLHAPLELLIMGEETGASAAVIMLVE